MLFLVSVYRAGVFSGATLSNCEREGSELRLRSDNSLRFVATNYGLLLMNSGGAGETQYGLSVRST